MIRMNSNVCRFIVLSLVVLLLLSSFVGCNSRARIIVGNRIEDLKEDYKNFSNSWITDRKKFESSKEGWRIGSMDKSVKLTSGVNSDEGLWYLNESMPESWVLNTNISFQHIEDEESNTTIMLGTNGKDIVMALELNWHRNGKVKVTMESLIPSKKVVLNTDYIKTSDSSFDITLVNKEGDNKIGLYVKGESGYLICAETEEIDNVVFESMHTFGFSSTTRGVNFQRLAFNDNPNAGSVLLNNAHLALNDMYRNFWTGDSITGHIEKEDHGYKTQGRQTMIWAHAMMLFGMEIMYDTTGDVDIKNRIEAHWEFTKDNFTEEILTRPGREPNIAVDDAGWDAMVYMLFYRMTGDPYALRVTEKLIKNSYEYWKDGSIENGLWYLRSNNPETDAKWKSLYQTGLMLAALEYYEVVKDEQLFNDTLALYNWTEENLLRNGKKQYDDYTIDCNDNLYWADFNVDRETRSERNGPDGGRRPYDIQEAGSVSFLGGNMAMAVIHAKLYKITGEDKYKVRALETVAAINNGPHNNNGVYVNDRDAWTNGAFAGWWVREVLSLPEISEYDKTILKDTAYSIFNLARTEDGYYGGGWSCAPQDSKWTSGGSKPEQIMTSASSTNMIYAAALLERLEQEQ